mgnify:CR=1 FL=1
MENLNYLAKILYGTVTAFDKFVLKSFSAIFQNFFLHKILKAICFNKVIFLDQQQLFKWLAYETRPIFSQGA